MSLVSVGQGWAELGEGVTLHSGLRFPPTADIHYTLSTSGVYTQSYSKGICDSTLITNILHTACPDHGNITSIKIEFGIKSNFYFKG